MSQLNEADEADEANEVALEAYHADLSDQLDDVTVQIEDRVADLMTEWRGALRHASKWLAEEHDREEREVFQDILAALALTLQTTVLSTDFDDQ